MVRGILVIAQEMLSDERPHGDREVRQGGSEREPHALTTGFTGELEERGFLGVAIGDEARLLGELGHGVVPIHERLGELALDEACEDILTLLGHDGSRGVMLSVLSEERLIAGLDGAQGQHGRMGVEREDAVSLSGELLPCGGGGREVDTLPGAFTQFPASHADEPLVLAALQLDEFRGGGLGDVDAGLLGLAVTDLKDAASAAMDAVLVVALADITPVENRNGAVGPLA